MNLKQKSQLIKKFIVENPTMPNQTLAKMIYNKYKEDFLNVEQIRTSIRAYKGSGGKTKRRIFSKELFTEKAKELVVLEGFEEGIDESKPPFIFPKHLKNTLVISDLHIPFHVKEAVITALEYGKSKNIDSILINGDLMEMRAVSTHNPTLRERLGLANELEACRAFLKGLRNNFPEIPIYYKMGNHERWFNKTYLPFKAPELLGISECKLEVLLKLEEYNIIPLDDMVIIKYGKLNIIHGHEIRTGMMAPVNPARGLYLRAKVSTLEGHVHRTSEHTETDINRNTVTCWSIGCLSQLTPEYAGIASSYNLGFAHITKEENGDFHVNNLRIINGKVR